MTRQWKVGDNIENTCGCGCADEEGQRYAVVEEVHANGNIDIRFENGDMGPGYTNNIIKFITPKIVVPEALFEI